MKSIVFRKVVQTRGNAIQTRKENNSGFGYRKDEGFNWSWRWEEEEIERGGFTLLSICHYHHID